MEIFFSLLTPSTAAANFLTSFGLLSKVSAYRGELRSEAEITFHGRNIDPHQEQRGKQLLRLQLHGSDHPGMILAMVNLALFTLLLQFFMGLGGNYNVRQQILVMDPTPFTNEAYYMVASVEKQRQVHMLGSENVTMHTRTEYKKDFLGIEMITEGAALPLGGDVEAGRDDQPRPGAGRGDLSRPEVGRDDQPRPALSGLGDLSRPGAGRGVTASRGVLPRSAPGRGDSPRPVAGRLDLLLVEAVSLNLLRVEVVSLGQGLAEARFGWFHLAEALRLFRRNLPKSHSDSLEILMGSDSSQRLVSSLVHVQSDELESSVAPQSKLRCRVMDVENCDSSLSLEEFDFLKKKFDPSSTFDFRFPRERDRIRMSPLGAGLFDQMLDVKSLLASGKRFSLQDIQRYKAEREREPREPEATEAPLGIGKGLFSYGINGHERVASFWDAFDYDLAYVRSRSVVSDYDVARFSSLGDHTVSRLLFGESARVATLIEVVDQHFKSYDKELKRSKVALKEMKKELACCQEQLKEASEGQTKWRDRYNREVSSVQGFLKSEAGKIYLECIWNDFKEKYEDSEEFEGAVVARANDIYDQAIKRCRIKLRESGRFVREDFTFLDPLVADEDAAEEGEVEVVDEPPAEGACVDIGGDRP
ncbi:hypothetical protein Sango_0372700 [Sesamum angolense]|uniref:Uncharacterized protein n=1 Tax=Sesamum angolense TaxID=2727404 RepID=A0AAE1X9R2_9LAMI|nr:hypothetical protein Sango_0372700 [Sesamum angolense]